MNGFGLGTMVINADTIAEARKSKINLWTNATTNGSVILISPEELQARDFTRLLDHKDFNKRLCVLGIDEIHLLHWWGKSFRPAFTQLGLIRARLPLRRGHPLPIVGTTATLREGPVKDAVCTLLGLKSGQYHLIRRSNLRNDIQLIFRAMKSGIGGIFFPELDWILDEGRNTVIFCKSIHLGFRVACYLWRRANAKGLLNLDKRIRLYNSLNWPSYNTETLGFLNNHEDASITVASDTLSVGWDSQWTEDAVILGEPDDVDEFVQKIGRIGRNRAAGLKPRGILYHTRSALTTAQKVVDQPPASFESTSQTPQSNTAKKKKDETTMDISMAHVLLSPCKPKNLDGQYENPSNDPICLCPRCLAHPRPLRPESCNCSGPACQPETNLTPINNLDAPKKSRKPRARRGEGITPDLRKLATAQLDNLRRALYRNIDPLKYGFLPPEAFFPDILIKSVIDNIYSLQTPDDIIAMVAGYKVLEEHHGELLGLCNTLRDTFSEERKKKADEKKGLQQPSVPLPDESEESSEREHNVEPESVAHEQNSDMEIYDVDVADLGLQLSAGTFRINLRNGTIRVV